MALRSAALSTVGEKTYQRLFRAIVNGGLKPGESLPQEHLAKKLKVSVNTVRGALLQLERDGLVEIVPKWGVRVVSPDRGKVVAQFELRAALECEAARLCTQRASPEALAEILRLAQSADEPIEAGRPREDAQIKADYQMHDLIMRSADSPEMYAAWRRLHVLRKLVWVDRLQQTLALAGGRVGANTHLAEALAARDPEKAGQAVREHIEVTRDLVVRGLECVQQPVTEESDDAWMMEDAS